MSDDRHYFNHPNPFFQVNVQPKAGTLGQKDDVAINRAATGLPDISSDEESVSVFDQVRIL